ncbi:hypothetical protein FOC1_g10001431 [Fusarium oxysporum f. sp. cubense race 1]|uniref:Malate dehydrogenase n=1 Tax=Fusarium oxysporum f. sp. cubense (strain race 1) TaxID=1229664 RepID=N4U5N4_FUSC1|nr:hypothetical protein FOC1_g10001431 [Fusarium oxysporum f. sp. cubense race 1]
MLVNPLLALTSATLALASPARSHGQSSSCGYGNSMPILPVNGGPSELPAPARDVTLKHIALGFGIQNYSCTDAGATPVATGALAVLYDVTFLYPVPLNRTENGGASPTNPFPKKKALEVKSLSKNIPYLGHHFFSTAGIPTFDLDPVNQLLIAKKINGIKAPASAPTGPGGTSAVDWLYLGDAGGSHGVSLAYRVLTAGGSSYSCKGKGIDSISYTAYYWFYG